MYADEEILRQKMLIREMAENFGQASVDEEIKVSILEGKVPIFGEEFSFSKRLLKTQIYVLFCQKY